MSVCCQLSLRFLFHPCLSLSFLVSLCPVVCENREESRSRFQYLWWHQWPGEPLQTLRHGTTRPSLPASQSSSRQLYLRVAMGTAAGSSSLSVCVCVWAGHQLTGLTVDDVMFGLIGPTGTDCFRFLPTYTQTKWLFFSPSPPPVSLTDSVSQWEPSQSWCIAQSIYETFCSTQSEGEPLCIDSYFRTAAPFWDTLGDFRCSALWCGDGKYDRLYRFLFKYGRDNGSINRKPARELLRTFSVTALWQTVS